MQHDAMLDVERGGCQTGKPTAIVIGAGFGGISAAGRLARAGYSVTCIEMHATPGGRCCEILEQGHRFDVGPSIILVPSAYREAFTAMGDDLDRHLEFLRIDPTYKIHFHDGTSLELTADLQRMEAQLESFERGAFKSFLALLRQGHDNLHKTLAAIAHRNFYSLFEFFSVRNGFLIWQLGVLHRHYNYVSSLFSDARLRAAFSFQDMYIGVSPFDAPSTFSLLQYTEFCDGVWYCRGGLARISDALAASAQAAGVRFLYSTQVDRILVDGTRATGVTLVGGVTREDGGDGGAVGEGGITLSADVVVCAADLPWAYRNLLPVETDECDQRVAQKMSGLHYTSSAIMFYWGLDTQYLQLETHNMFLAQDFKGSFDEIFAKFQLPDEPSFYIHVPSRCDPSAAPATCDSLMVLVPCGHLRQPSRSGGSSLPQDAHSAQAEWAASVERARRAVLARLRSDKGIVDLDQHLKFEKVYTPHDWATRFNLERGSCFGLSHTFFQLGWMRPQNQHARYRNLFFAGCSTHPGSGLPNVLLSARLAVERVLMHSAGYATASPVEQRGAVAVLAWVILTLWLASSRYALSYGAFHALFTLPWIAVLAARLRVRMSAEASGGAGGVGAREGGALPQLPQVQRVVGEVRVLRRRMLRAGVVLGLLAVSYTTPWDNYLVWKGIWSYPPGRVLATIGWVPVEEYSFFLIQTALTLLWFLAVLERHLLETRLACLAGSSPYEASSAYAHGGLSGSSSSSASGVLVRGVGVAMMGFVAICAWWCVLRGPQSCLYMALILGWGMPVLAVQWAFGGHVTCKEASLIFNGLALPTLYLWFADALAIEMGIWEISPAFLLGLYVPFTKLPLEEMTFFLVTNLMVLQGSLLFVRLAERMNVLYQEEGKKSTPAGKSLLSRVMHAALRL